MNPTLLALQPDIQALLPKLDALYEDLHQHPELSMQEVRTAALVAKNLHHCGYQVTEKVG